MLKPTNTHAQNLEIMAVHLFEKHCIATHGDLPPFIPSIYAAPENGLNVVCTFDGCPWKAVVR